MMAGVRQQATFLLLTLAFLLASFTTTDAFLIPATPTQKTHQKVMPTKSVPLPTASVTTTIIPTHQQRRSKQELIKMEVDPAVVGGVIAGVVGVGLGVGAMIFTEKQTLRREERKKADREAAKRAAQRAAAAATANAQEGGQAPVAGGGDDEDGW